MTDLSADLMPPYVVDGIEFRDRMVVVNYAEKEDLEGNLVNIHKSMVIMPGDEDCNIVVAELLDGIYRLIDFGYIAKRNPPKTRHHQG